MMFFDLNLMADDEISMIDALLAAGFSSADNAVSLHHPAATVLLLPEGMITRPSGEVITVGGVVVEGREPVPGYHANVRTTSEELAAALAPVTVVVESPQYVWA